MTSIPAALLFCRLPWSTFAMNERLGSSGGSAVPHESYTSGYSALAASGPRFAPARATKTGQLTR